MIGGVDAWRGVVDSFAQAAIGSDWSAALNSMADACGAERGELIGVGSDKAVPFNWLPRTDPLILSEFAALGGGDPRLNPRVRKGVQSGVLEAWHDVRCATDEQLRTNFVYADFCRRWDIPYGSQTNLLKQDGMLIGLAVLRGEQAGVPQGPEREAFEQLIPHVRSAVLTQMTLEGQGALIMSGALEAVGAAAFVFDGLARVQALTPAAEAVVKAGRLRLAAGRLTAPSSAGGIGRELEAAIAAAVRPALSQVRQLQTVILRWGEAPADLHLIDVVSLPVRPYGFGFQPCALAIVRGGERAQRDVGRLLSRAYSLSAAEAEVAAALAAGETREQIAESRGVAIGTVRAQIKSIFMKVAVNRESQLATVLRQFF